MNYINLTILVSLILVYAVFSYFELKSIKLKVSQVLGGKIDNKRLSKLINKAQKISKNDFALYMFLQAIMVSFFVTILLIVIDLFVISNELNILKYLFVFFFVSIVLSINGIAKANSIWKTCR
jgi:hypothetical protein